MSELEQLQKKLNDCQPCKHFLTCELKNHPLKDYSRCLAFEELEK